MKPRSEFVKNSKEEVCDWMLSGAVNRFSGVADNRDFPLVSVVIPSFNQGEFIEATLLSVLKQSYTNLECLVVDGGSTDGTRAVLRRYEPCLAYWVSEPDNGQTEAINKGLKKARGDILAYLNSDDVYWRTDAVAHAVNAFREDEGLDMVYGDICVMDDVSRLVRRCYHPGFDRERLERDSTYFIPQQAVFFRRRILEKVGFFDEKLHFKMDREFYIRVAHAGKVRHLPQLMAGFRTHPAAKSNPWNVVKCWKEWHYIRVRHGLPVYFKSDLYFLAGVIYGLLPRGLRNQVKKLRYRD